MPNVIQVSDIPTIFTDEVVTVNFLLDLYPASSNAQMRFLDARLTVDSVNIPIESFSFDETETDIAATLRCELARVSDRSAITRGAVIKFETGEKLSGSWVWKTLLDTAKLRQSDYSLANKDLSPDDSFSLTAMSVLESRLEKTPLGTVTLHDPAKVTINPEDLLSVPDIDGVANPVVIVPISNMTLASVFNYLATICGFAGYQTNIPDFPLRRVDFQPGEPYWGSVSGIIGVFKPILDIDQDDKLIIRDGTSDALTDTSSARELLVSDIVNIGNSSEINRFKGVLLTYQLQGLGWDYYADSVDNVTRWAGGVAGQYPVVNTQTVTRKYYRNSFPNTPVNSHIIRQTNITRMPLTTVAATGESFIYDNLGNLVLREKRYWGRVKTPGSWGTFCSGVPGAGFDSSFVVPGASLYTSTSGEAWSTAFVVTQAEQEQFIYLADPYEAESVYVAYRETTQDGLITIDSTEQQLSDDFTQPLLTGQRSGNLKTELGAYWGTTQGIKEWTVPLPNRQAIIRTTRQDHLNAGGDVLVPDDYSDPRVGDIGISSIKHIQKQAYIYDGADGTATKIQAINAGEAPLSVAKPLAIRYNREQFLPSKVKLEIPGIDLSLNKGRAVDPKVDGRASVSFGTYRIMGRSISGAEKKFRTTLTAKQIGLASEVADVTKYSADLTTNNESMSLALESGQSRTIAFPVICVTGRQLSGMVVADVVVEARHGISGGWTNIETTPIALDPWNGTSQTFQVRITAGTITAGHIIHSFQLRIGNP